MIYHARVSLITGPVWHAGAMVEPADISTTVLPSRRSGKRRDRHGRGMRGPLLPPTVPGARSRSEQFDVMLLTAVQVVEHRLGQNLNRVDYAVEDVPPSAPAPWEAGAVSLGRYFPAEPAAGLRARIVLYRRPITSRALGEADLAGMIYEVVVEQIAHLLGRSPEEIDPDHPG